MNNDDPRTIRFRLSDAQLARLKAVATRDGLSLSVAIRVAVFEYLQRNAPRPAVQSEDEQ